MTRITQPAKDFRALLPADYRKREVIIETTERVTFYDLNWSGGTRNEYRAIDLATGQMVGSMAKWNAVWPGDNIVEGKTTAIPEGIAVVRTGFFCGKASRATIYVNPRNIPKLLGHN